MSRHQVRKLGFPFNTRTLHCRLQRALSGQSLGARNVKRGATGSESPVKETRGVYVSLQCLCLLAIPCLLTENVSSRYLVSTRSSRQVDPVGLPELLIESFHVEFVGF